MESTITERAGEVESQATRGLARSANRRTHSRRDAAWMRKQAVKCDSFAEEKAIVVQRGKMLAAWSMIRDTTGAEIERHLATLARPYVELLVQAAWRVRDGKPTRSWQHWPARAIAVVGWFLALHAMPTELHGKACYRVAGFTMQFFRMLVSSFEWVNGQQQRVMPARSTFGHVSTKRGSQFAGDGWVGELVRVGLLEAHQFDADKVAPHERGPVKRDPVTGETQQWAFNQWFLHVSPFEPGELKPRPLGKRRNKFVVRAAVDSMLHRMRRKERRKIEEQAARDRAAAEVWRPQPAQPDQPSEPATAPSGVDAGFLSKFEERLRRRGRAVGGELGELLRHVREPKPPD